MLGKLSVRRVDIRRNGRHLLHVHDLTVGPGEIVAILGENGTGKTSLLRILAGLDTDFQGDIRYNEQIAPAFFRSRQRPRQLLLVPQDPVMFACSVEKNIDYGLRRLGMAAAERRERVRAALEFMGIPHLAGRRAMELSGGETKRVALARALVLRPRFLLLDEPFSGIDRAGRVSLEERLRAMVTTGTIQALLFTTHQQGVALRLTETILHIHDARLLPYQPLNIYRGQVVQTKDHRLFETGGVRLFIPPFERPPRLVHIPPTDIILSRRPVHSTARNHLEGHIDGLSRRGDLVDVTVQAGIAVVARISLPSLQEYGLTVGNRVHLYFKISAIQYPGQTDQESRVEVAAAPGLADPRPEWPPNESS
ncbi:MAG: ABC transporter ATP-binding protein [Acidobacteria bacterium]|nr:ABC transporter ATP-binding protein [Acidobacteriota bacterium]